MTDHPPTDEVRLRLADADDVEALTKLSDLTWDGRDFFADLVDEWLSDATGELVVAELAGRVVATIKVSRLAPAHWWLEALRVHPDARTRGIGSLLVRHGVERVVQLHSAAGGVGTIGGLVDESNVPSLRVFTAAGFTERVRFARCTSKAAPDEASAAAFRPLTETDIDAALALVQRSDALSVAGGNQGGRAIAWPIDAAALQRLAVAGQLHGWYGVRSDPDQLDGLVAFGDVTESASGSTLHVTYLDALDALSRIAVGVRALAAMTGAAMVSHQLQATPARIGAMLRAGWRRPAGLNMSVLLIREVGDGEVT